jgi:hypothetical protein
MMDAGALERALAEAVVERKKEPPIADEDDVFYVRWEGK